jgi:hypothetical protein
VIVGELAGHERGGLDDCERRVCFTVNEFRSELDGKREVGDVKRMDATADTLARFDDADSFSCAR